MSSKTIYLIRHGETDYNRRGVVQGSGIDADLNALGQAQAHAFYDAYQHVAFDKIYTSALKRTHQSVAKFLEKGLPHQALPELNEISWGGREGKVPNSMDSEYYRMLIGSWRNGQTNLPAEGGESPDDVQRRLRVAVQHILENTHEHTVLVAMHGRAMRVLLATIFEQPLYAMDQFEHTNLGLYLLDYQYNNKKFVLHKTNDTTHLLTLPA
ncbi:MAG: histidine phosphatase family protein [Runella slithyformis]|nr:MAG: histidine phosphatase family protein [Runella slithyformis]